MGKEEEIKTGYIMVTRQNQNYLNLKRNESVQITSYKGKI